MKKLWFLAVIASLAAPVLAAQGLPFIQDNYPKALADAKQRNVPIFVECWAPW